MSDKDNNKKKKPIKKRTKNQVIEYYYRLAYPEEYEIDYVPVDLKMKSFEKLLSWQGVKIPEQVKEDKKMGKMLFEIIVKE